MAVAEHDLIEDKPRRSLLMDAEQYASVEELIALAMDKKSWAMRVKQIDPMDHNTAAAAVNSHLDADAEEWLRGAVAMDGRFKG